MVQVQVGLLVTCDPTIKEVILKIDRSGDLGRCFIMADLDECHLLIDEESLMALQKKLAEHADRLHFADDQTEEQRWTSRN